MGKRGAKRVSESCIEINVLTVLMIFSIERIRADVEGSVRSAQIHKKLLNRINHTRHITIRCYISKMLKRRNSGRLYVVSFRAAFGLQGRKGTVNDLLNRRHATNEVAYRQAISVQKILKERYVPDITSIEYEGLPVEPPTPILWFPDQLAWQMSTPKNVVRRFAPFKSFQSFLVSETSIGNINRQEVVSMIPPLLIDIKPGMTVLDLCAAPGSKSAQLIEMLHGGEEARIRKVLGDRKRQEGREMSPHGELLEDEILGEEQHGDWSDDGRSTGLLIANDVDYKRAHMLIHQMKRLNSPNLIVTNHDATMYPSIKIPVDAASDGKPRHRYLKFDRILADVPCSGDGTCRKNPSVWKNWTPGNALGLFSIQVRILVRALQMTKTGGRVVYSTCSMNPVENEAVVASAIERCEGVSKIEVVDCSDRLPGLKREPGLHEWKVMDKSTKIWSSWSEVEREKELHGEEGLGKLVEGMFPRNDFPFDRCMRVYPHLQDTGGFFIAVLEKKAETRAKPDNENRKVHTTPSVIAIVNEIEAKSANGIDSNLGIEALDNFMAPREGANAQDVSPAARQNREVVQDQAVDISKHELYDEADDFASSKRLRTRDGLVEPAPRGAEDRQVHWPPPPGAQLEVSRPEAMKLTEPTSSQQGSPYKAKANEKQQFEEPFKYLDPDHRELQIIYDFYQLSANFPRNRYMVRNATGNPTKTIYYTSALARNILTTNEGSGLKTVHCGVKMFVKQDVQKEGVCKWRMQTEGLPLVEASVGEERVVRLTKRETLRKLLVEMFPKVDGSGWKDLAEIGARVRDITMGCCVLRVEKGEGQDEFWYACVIASRPKGEEC